ncbi:unnamed protein product [Effrenium voratum]|nr:unnamed protein product [Effrenium voratum]
MVQQRANLQQRRLYSLSSDGPEEVTERLMRALEFQWASGYPFLPAGEDQLTHGFFKYIAGMQALCARELLQLVPDARQVLDMFCGSGTVLVESLVAGKRALGCDVSPLALLLATHHTDARDIDLQEFLGVSERLAEESGDWQALKSQIAVVSEVGLRDALQFVLLVSLSRASDETYLHSSSKAPADEESFSPYLFLGVARLYASRVGALRHAIGGEAGERMGCDLFRCDNRLLRLESPVDAIITGPPYPGVYDYHAVAQECAEQLGDETLFNFCAPGFSIHGAAAPTAESSAEAEKGESSAEYAPGREIGQNSLWLEDPNWAQQWQAQQEAWLDSAFANLRPGGTATLMIGDGDASALGDGGFDCLQSTLQAAAAAGFETVATATIRARSRHPKQPKGMKRTEHMGPCARRVLVGVPWAGVKRRMEQLVKSSKDASNVGTRRIGKMRTPPVQIQEEFRSITALSRFHRGLCKVQL